MTYALAATSVVQDKYMTAFQIYTCVLSQKALHCLCRQYDYGSNKVIPHTVKNSSDASSASGNADTADKVSFSGGLRILRALCTIYALRHCKRSCTAEQRRQVSFVNAWLGVFV